LALPREAQYASEAKYLAKGLGENPPIEFQGVPAALPKPNVLHEALDGPADQKRRSASAATKRGAKEKSRHSNERAKNRNRRQPAQVERRFFTVADGRETIGFIKQTGQHFIATTAPDRVELGDFASLRAAFLAIATHGDGHA
jgi:hypothetical protein